MLLACVFSAVLIGLAIMQTGFVWWFLRFLKSTALSRADQATNTEPEKMVSDQAVPRVALVLCLRGADPNLTDCLRGIQQQNYSAFELHLVVDDLNDPALSVANKFYDHRVERPQVPVIHCVDQPFPNCSLKCSALLTAMAAISAEIEIIALVDADTLPDENWLSDLVAPLVQSDVGATTGNRWFEPKEPTLGSYVRQIWNTAAIVQMDFYNIAWGGTLALKRSTFQSCDLKTKWSEAFCEDTLLTAALAEQDLQLVRVPSLICENVESTSLSDAFHWIKRQLITIRLHHRDWRWVLLHAMTTLIASLLIPLTLIALAYNQAFSAFGLLASVWLFFQWLNWRLMRIVERANLEVLGARQAKAADVLVRQNLTLKIAAMLILQYLHPFACLAAVLARRVRWRGIEYRIGSNPSVKMVEYQPYRLASIASRNGDESIR